MVIQIVCALICLFVLGAISFRNPLYCLLSLIAAFCSVAALMIAVGMSYIGFMLLIVYVGAVAILFLFVIMMLNIKQETLRTVILQKRLLLPILVGGGLCGFVYITHSHIFHVPLKIISLDILDMAELLYTKYSAGVLIMGLILLQGIVTVITIIGLKKSDDRALTNYDQILDRMPENSIRKINVERGKGVKWI